MEQKKSSSEDTKVEYEEYEEVINKVESNDKDDDKEEVSNDESESENTSDDEEEEEEEEDPMIAEIKEGMLLEIAYGMGLDVIKYCRNENVDEKDEVFKSRLNLKVSTWMAMYKNLDEPEEFMLMRDVSIGIGDKLRGFEVPANEFGDFINKYKETKPYNFFLTSVSKESSTHEQPYSVSFHEILDFTSGVLDESLHIYNTIDLSWTITEYMIACQMPQMTVIYENFLDPESEYTIPFKKIELQKALNAGTLNSKLSILKYKDERIRLIISTANLCALDWTTRTNGLWVSPHLPLLPDDADYMDGESPTNFKKDFIEYLKEHKEPQIFGWLDLLYRTDFSAVKVIFVGSVPGSYEENVPRSKYLSWGQKKLSTMLSKHVILPSDAQNWPVVAQCSVVNSYGPDYDSWLHYTVCEMAKNQNCATDAQFKFIFPSKCNYQGSYDNELGKTPLTYSKETHNEQPWISKYLYQWVAEKTGRTKAMPHINCYTRISPDLTEILWFFLTSSDLSKSSFGMTLTESNIFNIKNYEAGILFVPTFLIKENTFPTTETSIPGKPPFLLPYDVPLTHYNKLEDDTFEEPYTNN